MAASKLSMFFHLQRLIASLFFNVNKQAVFKQATRKSTKAVPSSKGLECFYGKVHGGFTWLSLSLARSPPTPQFS
ncbi:MAG: hypothetical protein QXP19_03310, partial [Thermoproteota archaeon]